MGGASTLLLHVSEVSFPIQKRIEFGRLGGQQRRLSLRSVGGDGQTSSAPLWETVFQSSSFEPPRPQHSDCLIGKDTVGAAAVGNNLLRGIELGKAHFKFAQWYVYGTRQMPQC